MKLQVNKKEDNSTLATPFRRMTSWMNDPFQTSTLSNPLSWLESSVAPLRSREWEWMPKADICETEKEIEIWMDLPNVKAEDIDIEANEHSLTICGKTEEETEEEGKTWYRAERETGEFFRYFTLPQHVNAKDIEATTKNGVLRIIIPKKNESPKRKVKIAQK